MLPVINQTVRAEPISLYNPSRHPVHPFFGVRLTNTTDLTLMEGPVTIYYGDSYGGDALMETVEPKGERILTYALDMGVEVKQDLQETRTQVLTSKIVKGVLQQQVKVRRTNRYILTNREGEPRTVLVEQPYEGEWQLLDPPQAERTRNFYRFRVPIAAGKSATLQVVEERVIETRYALLETSEETLTVLLRDAQASEALRRALQEIINRRKQIAELEVAVRTQQEQIQAIERDQERIRANMRELDRASDLYKQYVQKLTQQEREIEAARQTIQNLQQQIQAARRALTDYIQNLVLE
jgi:DNA repair exonuclease SbcCD ATPase subunit